MRVFIFIGCLLAVTALQGAVTIDYRTIESRSGQIRARVLDAYRVPPYLRQDEVAAGIIVLSPELLTVSAERIKDGLLELLGSTDRWRGKIRFNFAPGKSNPNMFYVDSRRYTNGWNYRVTVSPKIRRQVWLRGCVGIFLLEMANRMADERTAEVPIWMIDGIATELSQSALVDLSPSFTDQIHVGRSNSGLGRVTVPQLKTDPLIGTRLFLAQNIPVSVSELFFPTAQHLGGNKTAVYQRSAHFFFRQLTSLRAGKASLQQFISSLSSYLNWQQAFFPSYQEQFTSMLEVEKWWSVALTDLTQLTPISSWSIPASLSYLDRILTPAALVGQKRDELARRQNFTIQQVMAQWDFEDQSPTLQQVTNRLRVLYIYAAPQLQNVIHGYLNTIQTYLTQRSEVGFESKRRGTGRLRADKVIRQAGKQLDRLDSQRQNLKPKTS
jgi:hypothetical protein